MTATGIDHIYIATHSYAATKAFWLDLGFTIGFETDHCSGQLLPPDGTGAYLFINEVDADAPTEMQVYLDVVDSHAMSGSWEDTHWGTRTHHLIDPDGNTVWLQDSH
jgi:catechol 2,3-dioxygenase-like lactoylglutathione lyase family enzyme